jgi:hypothetical protein
MEATEQPKVDRRGSKMGSILHDGPSTKTGRDTTLDEMVCPVCRRRIFSCSGASVRLKTRILIFENSCTIAKCKYCRNDIVVPVIMRGTFEERSLPLWNEDSDGTLD